MPWLVLALPAPVVGLVVRAFGVLLFDCAPSGAAFAVVCTRLSDSAESVNVPAVMAPVLSIKASVVSNTSTTATPAPAEPPTSALALVLMSVLLTALTVRSLPVAVRLDAPVTLVLAVLIGTETAIAASALPLPPFSTSLVDVKVALLSMFTAPPLLDTLAPSISTVAFDSPTNAASV